MQNFEIAEKENIYFSGTSLKIDIYYMKFQIKLEEIFEHK